MRKLKTEWKTKDKEEFNNKDISNLLFKDKFPSYISYPFKKWKHSSLSNFLITFELSHFESKEILPKDFIHTKVLLNNNFLDLFKLPTFLFFHLYIHYVEACSIWEKFFYENIKEFSKSEDSIFMWNAIKNSNNVEITKPKSIWITLCTINDREFWTNFAISLRESILGWLNPEMYAKYKDRLENTRTNIEYDNYRIAMAEDRVGDLEIKLPKEIEDQLNKPRIDEELDIIK